MKSTEKGSNLPAPLSGDDALRSAGQTVAQERAGQRDCAEKLRHQYTLDDLRASWDFVHHDFERFLALLGWFETLQDASAARLAAGMRPDAPPQSSNRPPIDDMDKASSPG